MEESVVMEDKALLFDSSYSTLGERVFFAARDGMSLTLYALLYGKNIEEIDDLLNKDVTYDGIKCTPLVAAARHGREGAVRILLDKFRPPVKLETEGTVKFNEYVIEGATALWCSAGAGHLAIVKRLVRAGANVNHATKTLSTPLRAACFDGRLDIVKYLVRHGADIHKANKFNNTCLMISAYKGHEEMVTFLLDSGARVDEQALCGATALHFAAECGHEQVVAALIDYGAKIMRNENGMTPLQCAAERARFKVVDLLSHRPEVTRAQVIEAYELLGASFANDKEFYCTSRAYYYLRKSMMMRFEKDLEPLPKTPFPPIPAYDNWEECMTVQEVETRLRTPHAIHMEGLCVRERVLGRQCPDVPHPIVFRGAVFADEAQFDKCLSLWTHALILRQGNDVPEPNSFMYECNCYLHPEGRYARKNCFCHGEETDDIVLVTVSKDLLRFAQVFSQMIHIGLDISLSNVAFVMEACAQEVIRSRERLAKPAPNQDLETLNDEFECNVRTSLYLISVAARLIDNSSDLKSRATIRRAIYGIRDIRLRNKHSNSGQTLLHMATDRWTPVDDFHTSDVCRFPCVRSVRLLADCGADIDAVDDRRRTPLHVALVSYQLENDQESWSEAFCGVVCELLGRGAHVDATDADGTTPLVASIGGPAESLIRGAISPRLSCLAAVAMATGGAKFNPELVPRDLHSFLEMHGVKPTR